MLERFGPLSAALAFLLFGVALRVALHRRAYGESGVRLLRGDTPSRVRDSLLLVLFATLLALGAARAVQARWVEATLACAPRAAPGVLLSLASTLALAACQAALGRAWRIGIDPTARDPLSTAGPYRLSRNPIYLCIFGVVAGFALALPSWLALAGWLGLVVGANLQVRAEERHLLARHGAAYQEYASRVGRWARWLGRGL